MVSNIQSNLIRVSHLIEGFKAHQALDGKDVQDKIRALELSCRTGFSPQNENLRTRAIQTLETLQTCGLSSDAVQSVSQAILSIKQAPHLEGPAQLAFFCDIDADDHNGAILSLLIGAAKGKVPFIASASMIIGKDIYESLNREIDFAQVSVELCKHHADWKVFAHEGYLVFLPADQTLESLDFKTDGTLREISMLEALQGSRGKKDLETFKEMFSASPKRSKLVYIAGHGNLSSTAAIDGKDYPSFLNFLNRQKCAGLTVTSCYSGGTSSLFYQPSEEIPKGLSFPVIVRSIGDFASKSGEHTEEDLRDYLDALAVFVESPTEATLHQTMKMVKGVEKGKWAKSTTNLAKIYFPHSPGSPGGFRPVGEGGKSYSITYTKLKQVEVGMNLPNYRGVKAIEVKGIDFLELHPLVIKAPLIIHDKAPVLLSMVPSNSHHFLASVQLKMITPEEFLQRTADFHSSSELGVNKGFFVSSLNEWNDVVLSLSRNFTYCLYRKGDQYYFRNLKGAPQQSVPITPFQYALQRIQIEKNTRTTQEAVRASSGGQESEAGFYEAVFRGEYSLPPAVMPFLKKGEIDPDVQQLDQKEKESLLFYLLEYNHSDIALKLFEKAKFSPDLKNLLGVPLICTVVKSGNLDFVKHLMEQNVNLNVDFTTGPLHVAVAIGRGDIAEELCKDKALNVDAPDGGGKTAISIAAGSHPTLFDQLKNRGANVNTVTTKGYTALTKCIFNNDPIGIDQVLTAGADPNLGRPSAVKIAILKGDLNLLKRLMQAGGKPFERNALGQSPFIDALRRGDPDTVAHLLEHPDCKVDPEAIAAVIESANSAKIELVRNTGALLTDPLERFTEYNLKKGIKLFALLGDWKTIELFLKWLGTSKSFRAIVSDVLIEANTNVLENFLRAGILDPDVALPELVQKAKKDFTRFEPLLKFCVEQGADATREKGPFSPSPLEDVIQDKKFEIVKILLQGIKTVSKDIAEKLISLGDLEIIKALVGKGIDLKDTSLFCKGIETENLEIIEFFIQQGTEINPETEGSSLPMELAANAKNPKILERLVELGGDLNRHGTSSLASPFAILASNYSPERVKWALQRGAEVNPPNPQGLTPLEAAKGNPSIVNILLDAGAAWTEQAVAACVLTGDLDFISTCQSKGANIGTEKCFIAAIFTGNIKVLEKVRLAGGAITPETISERKLLYPAYQNIGKELFIDFLRSGGELQDNWDRSLLWILIIKRGDLESFLAFLEKENDLSIPYKAASRQGSLDMVLEVEKRDPSNTVKLTEEEFLLLVVLNEHIDLMKYFFTKGYDPQMEIWGSTLFQLAVRDKKPKTLKFLLDLGGFDPEQKVKYLLDSYHPLAFAVKENHPEMVQILRDAGAKITPEVIDRARRLGNPKILKILGLDK